jgi:hypothetical protein
MSAAHRIPTELKMALDNLKALEWHQAHCAPHVSSGELLELESRVREARVVVRQRRAALARAVAR